MVISLKILFKNTTKYNKNIYMDFLEFHRKKYRWAYILYTATILALLLFCVIIQIKNHNLTLAILFCIVITCFFLWRYLHPISEVSKEFRSEKIQDEKEFTFIFYKNYFKIRDKLQFDVISYYKLYRIYETSTFFYLYIDRSHAFLLDKSSFLLGSSEEFSEFIRKKCWYKFKKVLS